MKKALILLLSVLLISGLVACSGAPDTPDASGSDATTTVATTTATDAADPTTTGGAEDPTDPVEGETTGTTAEGTTGPTQNTTVNGTSKPTTSTTKKPTTTTTKKKLTAEEIYKNLKRSDRDCEEYSLDKYMANLWTSNVTYNETFLPVRNKDGSIDPIRLMYPVDKILAIHDGTCNYTYFEGKDFTVENGCIVLTENTNIKALNWDQFYITTNNGMATSVEEGRYLLFGEGSTFHAKQYAVSYIHTETWTDTSTMPENKADLLPKTLKKLKNKESINIVLTGDSISTGGNASGRVNMGPWAPGWDVILHQYWEDAFDTKINFTNIAEGGSVSPRGVELLPETNALKPDLLICGFGMNDSTWSHSTEKYIRHTLELIEGVRAENPDCEFILMSSMLSNPEEAFYRGFMLKEYREALYELEEVGIVVADITKTHEAVLTRKKYADMTGNNINHPNDFLNRIYAQTVGFLLTDEGV